MLSQTSPVEPVESSIATATSQLREAAPNRRRHSSLKAMFGQLDGAFFKSWFIEGPRRLIHGDFSGRAACFMIASAVPGIIVGLMMTLPGMLFNSPDHHAFYYFAKSLQGDFASILPVTIGTLCSLISLRFTLVG